MPLAVALLNFKKSRNTFADFFPKRIFRGFSLTRVATKRSLGPVEMSLKITSASNAQARSASKTQ